MAHGRSAATDTTYLVEHYRPGEGVDKIQCALARIREAVTTMEREGKPIRHLRSTIVPADEAYLCLIDADSQELVREAYARARVPFERISTAIAAGDETAPNELQPKGVPK